MSDCAARHATLPVAAPMGCGNFGHRVVGHVEMTTVFDVVGCQHVEASRRNCGPDMGHLQGSFESVG